MLTVSGDESDDPDSQWWDEDHQRVYAQVPESFIEELAAAYPESRSLSEAAWLAMFDGVQSKNE